MDKRKRVLALLLMLPLLVSCWDRTEIEEVGFVIAASVTSAESVKEDEEFDVGEDKLALTYQVAIPARMVGGGEEAQDERPFLTVKTTERSNFGANRNLPSRRPRLMNYEHLKVVLLEEELVEKNMLKYVLDFFIRDHEMRRNTEVFIVDGDASMVLNDDRLPDPLTGMSIMSTAENETRDLAMLEPRTISYVTNALLNNSNFVVPRLIERENTSYRVRGGAIFSGDGKFMGWLSDEMTIGLKLMEGNMKNGIVETAIDDEQDKLFVFETSRMSRNIEVDTSGETPSFHVSMKAEGTLVESWIEDEEAVSPAFINEMEESVESYMVDQAEKTDAFLQEDLYLDILGLVEELRIQDHELWRQLKDDWDGPEGVFRGLDITISADVKIRHFMTKERVF
ncbi:Ger(x)C family spore germination protein [Alteribacter natronophilus]|uniref:Ger(x)C family spore germination protein n=1 Tax=Alteribacter natronophilus TaxID=2583810 RepID=UPI00110E8582|nr:Ger(x)C family spore germination protein [Alteribacter natronophilus]TMW73994.1 Ger(x)C family spore germination protein [Alteribacter natronophilus]